MSSAENLKDGKTFPDTATFQHWLNRYQERKNVKFSVKTSKKIENCRTKGPFKDGLTHYEMYYQCNRAGTFATKGKGQRQYSTKKVGCPASFAVRVRDKSYYVLSNVVTKHNHSTDDTPHINPVIGNEIHSSKSMTLNASTTGKDSSLFSESSFDEQAESVSTKSKANEERIINEESSLDDLDKLSQETLVTSSPDWSFQNNHLLNDDADANFEKSTETFGTLTPNLSIREKVALPDNVDKGKRHASSDVSLHSDDSTVGIPASTNRLSPKIRVSHPLKRPASNDEVTTKKLKPANISNFDSRKGRARGTTLTGILQTKLHASKTVKSTKAKGGGSETNKELNDVTEMPNAATKVDRSQVSVNLAVASKNLDTSKIPKRTRGRDCPRQMINTSIGKNHCDLTKMKNSDKDSDRPHKVNHTATAKEKLDAIKMPKVAKGKGRPRGVTLTAIGLPKKSKKIEKFVDKDVKDQAITLLKWLNLSNKIGNIIDGEYKVKKKDLNLVPREMRDSFGEQEINTAVLLPYFEKLAFNAFKRAVAIKAAMNNSRCQDCQKQTSDEIILCDSCLLWIHFQCAGITRKPPAKKPWFCNHCKMGEI